MSCMSTDSGLNCLLNELYQVKVGRVTNKCQPDHIRDILRTVCPKIQATSCLSSPHYLIGRRRSVKHLDRRLVDGRRTALCSEDEVDSEASHADRPRLLWFCGLWQGRRQADAGNRKTTTKQGHPAACAGLPPPLP